MKRLGSFQRGNSLRSNFPTQLQKVLIDLQDPGTACIGSNQDRDKDKDKDKDKHYLGCIQKVVIALPDPVKLIVIVMAGKRFDLVEIELMKFSFFALLTPIVRARIYFCCSFKQSSPQLKS